MKVIKKINEYFDVNRVYIVTFYKVNDTDFFKSKYISEQLFFHSEMKAYDCVVRYLNREYNTNFEVFFDDDGQRFCATLKENPDYKNIIEYMRKKDISINVSEISDNSYLNDV